MEWILVGLAACIAAAFWLDSRRSLAPGEKITPRGLDVLVKGMSVIRGVDVRWEYLGLREQDRTSPVAMDEVVFKLSGRLPSVLKLPAGGPRAWRAGWPSLPPKLTAGMPARPYELWGD